MASFNEILAGSDIVIGTATSNWETLKFDNWWTPNPEWRADYERIMLQNFSLLVAENAMKPDATEMINDKPPPMYKYDWNEDAKQLIKFAHDVHKLPLKGHCLGWHSGEQNPKFFWQLGHEAKRKVIRDHVGGVAAMMGGAGCVAIDVINECVTDDDPRRLRSFWTTDLGFNVDRDDSEAVAFMAECFRAAHEQAPHARLIINDYGTTVINDKSNFLYSLCKRIRDDPKGGPLHEVGFQTHQQCEKIDRNFLESMQANMARFKDLGMTCNISELDLWCDDFGGDGSEDDVATRAAARAAPKWGDFFRTALADRSVCTSVTLWGFDSRISWLKDQPIDYKPKENHLPWRFPCNPWRTDSGGVLQETAIVDSIRAALRDVLDRGPTTWQPFGCHVSTGMQTQNRSGGTFSGPQRYLPTDTECALSTRVVCASEVWLTLKSSDVDGRDWEFTHLRTQRIGDGAIRFRTTKKRFNVVYLEGPKPEIDFVVGPTFLNGQPMNWESTFPLNGSLRAVTYASDREGAFAGLMVAPPPGKTWTLTTRVYSRRPLKLTLKFWDAGARAFAFATLARADAAGAIAATFTVPAAAPNGTPAHAYIESVDGASAEDYAAEAPKLSLWSPISRM